MEKVRSCFRNFFEQYVPKFKHRFDLAQTGKENVDIVIWVWGTVAYIAAFLINKLMLVISFIFIKWFLSILVIAYFVWHILAVRRCTPKKPKITEEEKERLKKDRVNRFFRKLFLKEPIASWNSSNFATVVDLYIIVVFLDYLFR